MAAGRQLNQFLQNSVALVGVTPIAGHVTERRLGEPAMLQKSVDEQIALHPAARASTPPSSSGMPRLSNG